MLPRRSPAALLSPPPTCRWASPFAPRRLSTSQQLLRTHDRTPKDDTPLPIKDAAGQRSPSPTHSLFEELFPGEKKKTAQISEHPATTADSQTQPSSQATLVTHDASLAKWLHDPRKPRPPPVAGPHAAKEQDVPTTLILSGAPPTLEPSDLVRLATSSAAHLDGWAGGLLRTARALDRATLAPRGRYALTFESRHAALAYLDRATSLHSLGREGARRSGAAVAPGVEEALGGFALVPLTARLDARVLPGRAAMRWCERSSATAGADHAAGRVLVVLEGGVGTTLALMRRVLDEDGQQRNLPWRIVDARTGVVPVQWLAGKVGVTDQALGAELADVVDALSRLGKQAPPKPLRGAQRYSRFLISFEDCPEGRRFARAWHRRRVVDSTDGREVTINATLLW